MRLLADDPIPERDAASRPQRASRQQVEAFGADGAFNDLEPQLLTRRGAAGDVALVAGIGEQALEPRKAPSNPGTDQAQAVTIPAVGRASGRPAHGPP